MVVIFLALCSLWRMTMVTWMMMICWCSPPWWNLHRLVASCRLIFPSIWATGFTYHPWTMKFVCVAFASPGRKIEELMIGMQIPDEFRSPCRTKWFGLNGLLIVLRRLAYPARLADLVSEFGRPEAVLSLIFNTMVGWIWTRWGNVLSNPFAQPYFTASRTASYAKAVRQKSSVNLDVWGSLMEPSAQYVGQAYINGCFSMGISAYMP